VNLGENPLPKPTHTEQYVASAHFFQNIFRILNFSSDEFLKRKMAIFEQAQADSA